MRAIWNTASTARQKLDGELGPADWREQIEKLSLVGLVVDAVQTVDWPESDLKLTSRTGFAFRPLVMLTALTYCYAKGVYRSEEIELMVHRDEGLRYVCTGSYPSWREFEEFRRSHYKVIRQTLAE